MNDIINTLIWPVVVLVIVVFVCLLFKDSIRKIIGRVRSFTRITPRGNTTVTLEDRIHTLESAVEKFSRTNNEYDDHLDAFEDINKLIEELHTIENRQQLTIKIVAVAMTYSWSFLERDITRLLRKHPNLHIRIQASFVDDVHLSNSRLDLEDGTIWPDEALSRKNGFPEQVKKMKDRFGDRIFIGAKTYNNLPHWHGVLIDRQFLYLGRSSWSYPRSSPKLAVGENKYRHYDHKTTGGKERIKLFDSWHTYYFKHNFHEIICDSESSN